MLMSLPEDDEKENGSNLTHLRLGETHPSILTLTTNYMNYYETDFLLSHLNSALVDTNLSLTF